MSWCLARFSLFFHPVSLFSPLAETTLCHSHQGSPACSVKWWPLPSHLTTTTTRGACLPPSRHLRFSQALLLFLLPPRGPLLLGLLGYLFSTPQIESDPSLHTQPSSFTANLGTPDLHREPSISTDVHTPFPSPEGGPEPAVGWCMDLSCGHSRCMIDALEALEAPPSPDSAWDVFFPHYRIVFPKDHSLNKPHTPKPRLGLCFRKLDQRHTLPHYPIYLLHNTYHFLNVSSRSICLLIFCLFLSL